MPEPSTPNVAAADPCRRQEHAHEVQNAQGAAPAAGQAPAALGPGRRRERGRGPHRARRRPPGRAGPGRDGRRTSSTSCRPSSAAPATPSRWPRHCWQTGTAPCWCCPATRPCSSADLLRRPPGRTRPHRSRRDPADRRPGRRRRPTGASCATPHRPACGPSSRPATPRPQQLAIREIGTSVYAFRPAPNSSPPCARSRPQNAQGEYYLTDVIALLAGQGERSSAFVSPDPDVVRGVNTRVELVELAQTAASAHPPGASCWPASPSSTP